MSHSNEKSESAKRPAEQGKISAVMVTYNRNKDCKEAISTILTQRKPPHEVIVVDDAS